MANYTDLQQQLSDLEAQKVTLYDSGNANQVEVERLVEQIKTVRSQLDQLKQEEETAEAIETTAQEIATSLETYNIGDSSFTIDQLAADEDAAKILRKGIAENSQKQAQKWLEDINAQKSVYEQKVASLLEQLSEKDKTIDTLQNDNSQLHLENEDIAEKRDAAFKLAQEAQADVQRLNARVDELTQQLATTSPSNVVEITSDADLEAAAQRLKAKKEAEAQAKREADQAAKIRIYNVQQLDGTGSKFGANRADNDEYITFGWLEKNKYVELSGEEVQRFQQELAAQAALEVVANEDTNNTPLVEEATTIEVPQFQEEDTTVPEHTADGEVATTPTEDVVTRAEFYELREEVMNRLYNLEYKVHGADYVDTGDAA